MGKIYYNGVDYSAPVVSGVSGIKGNAETTYRTGNVNLTPANLGAAPISHAVTATTYGKGTGTIYGHVKLSDTYTSSVGDASSGVAASQKALFDAYSTLNSNLDDYKWTNWIHVGTVCGIELRYRYNEFQCSLSYSGTISNIITAYSQGYFWNNFPEALMPTMNILVPIVSNQDGLCLRCYPFESKKWYLASMKSDITNTVETYICGEYTYAHI